MRIVGFFLLVFSCGSLNGFLIHVILKQNKQTHNNLTCILQQGFSNTMNIAKTEYIIFYQFLTFDRRIRKPTITLGENKAADQMCSNCSFVFATQLHNSSSTYFQNFKFLAIFHDCTYQFMFDMVGNPNSWFSHAKAHFSQEQNAGLYI